MRNLLFFAYHVWSDYFFSRTALILLPQRRLTWCPGAALSKAPLASAAAVQARLGRIDASPSEESEFDEIPKEQFFSSLDREEETRSKEFRRKRVGFISPQATRFAF